MSARRDISQSGQFTPLLNRLQDISHDSVKPLLDHHTTLDPHSGIILVSLDLTPEEHAGLSFHFHGARIVTGEHNYVNPHYHKIGIEPYYLLSGIGEMNLGFVEENRVEWDEPRLVEAGELIVVEETEVHSLRNKGKDPLDFVFACPEKHLVDNNSTHPEGDRYFTAHLENGFPPQYAK